MNRRAVFWTLLVGLLLCRIPSASAEWDLDNPFREMIRTAATGEGVDPALVEAIIAVESAFRTLAVSRKGAMGLMQLMPQTARRYGVSNAFDPRENLTGGIRHLRDLLDLFGGDLTRTLAAYNAGVSAVLMHGGIPPYRETQNYVRMVLARYRPLQVLPASSPVPDESPVSYMRVWVVEGSSAPADLATRLVRTAARRPVTQGLRAPLVQARDVPTILVKPRDYPSVRSRERRQDQ
jgi:hypothetical protein